MEVEYVLSIQSYNIILMLHDADITFCTLHIPTCSDQNVIRQEQIKRTSFIFIIHQILTIDMFPMPLKYSST